MHHIDEFIDLLDDLLKARGIANDADSHAREASIAALGDDETVDIEAAASEYLADAHQYAGAVVDED
jgi:hypothetical protein